METEKISELNLKAYLTLGNKVLLLGATGAGKSTLIANAAASEVREILKLRLSKGNGTRNSSKVILTDNPLLDPDKIYFHAKIAKPDVLDLDRSSNITLFGEMCYNLAVFLSDTRKTDAEKDDNAVKASLANSFECLKTKGKMDNLNLISKLYQIKTNLQAEEIATIAMNVFGKNKEYREVLTGALSYVKKKQRGDKGKKPKNKDAKKDFQRMLFTDEGSNWYRKDWAKTFYNTLYDMLVSKMNEVMELIANSPDSHISSDDHDNTEFEILLSSSTSDLNQWLLSPNDKSVEFMLEDVGIMVRAAPDKNCLNSDRFRVAMVNGKYIHQITIIDTQGLGHSKADDADRVTEVVDNSNAAVILLLTSLVKDNHKESIADPILIDFLQTFEGEVPIIQLFNNYDKLLLECGENHSDNFDKIIKEAKNLSDARRGDVTAIVQEAIDSNKTGHKPYIVPHDEPIIMGLGNIFLGDKLDPKLTYDGAMERVFSVIAAQIGNKVGSVPTSVIDNFCSKNNISLNHPAPIPTTALVKNADFCLNNVNDVHWNTIYTAIDKWKLGCVHSSKAQVYANITTYFVKQLRDIAYSIFNSFSFAEKFPVTLNDLLINNSYRLGYIFAGNIGKYANDNTQGHYSCYSKFQLMLECLINLFAKNVTPNKEYSITIPDPNASPDVVYDIAIDSYIRFIKELINEHFIIIFD